MPKYTVTKVFTVEVVSKQEAIQKVTDEPGELLEYVRVFEQPGSTSGSGWKESARKQQTPEESNRDTPGASRSLPVVRPAHAVLDG